MASIKDLMRADLSEHYVDAEPHRPVLAQLINDNRPKANPFLRCPLPPFNSDPDTLRQFEVGTQAPQIRVMPLPVQATVATVSATSTASASSSTGSTTVVPVTPTLSPRSVTITTPVLAPGDNYQTFISAAKSFQMLAASSSGVSEVRLYGSSVVQAFDASRATDSPVPAEITSNVITCVVFEELPYNWPFQNLVGANQSTPQTTSLFVTVINASATDAGSFVVALTFLPLES